MTFIVNLRRQQHTLGIYFGAMQIKGGGTGGQHALTAQMQVHRERMMVKYNCQCLVF